MKSYKASRFLIDRIDQRLGNVDKEIKFDTIAIAFGIFLTIAGILMCSLGGSLHAGLFALGIILCMSGTAIMYVLTKELISDIKKQKN